MPDKVIIIRFRKHLVVFQGNNTEQTKIIDSKWIVDSEMTDRSVLSEELANFCPQYPIYQVKIMEDSLMSTRIQPKGEKTVI